jgi:N-acyl-D-aspartate/D-glutamate deacylase
MLGHWVRNAEAFTIEEAINSMTKVPADAWGFNDRGVLAEGKAADINVFDLATITPDLPEVVSDLPGGARRLRQTATGFRATIVNGSVLVEDGEPTGATPGQLLRGPLAR